MNDKIMVSVCCLVYNHEKYLRQCLDGIIMQKTNFKFEVLIHDDASTDGSADIIREYEEKYPDIIKPIYQKENQYSKGVRISWVHQYPRAKGRYIALCEGDDYWTDPNKLQKQFKIMESNDKLSMCTHKVRCVNEDGTRNERTYPDFELATELIPSEKILDWLEKENLYPFHTSSYFIKFESIKDFLFSPPDFIILSGTGSINLMILCAVSGDYFYIDQEMSSYRLNSIGSWSEKQKNKANRINHLKNWIITKQEVDKFLDYKYSTSISKQILEYEFEILLLKNDKRGCLDKKYSALFKKLSKKERTYIRLFAYFPKIELLYKRIKGRK